MAEATPEYLKPYAKAAAVYGGGFKALLWASPETQRARFGAFADHATFRGASVLDVGCGRADLLDFLRERRETPEEYIGIEGVEELAEAARKVPGVTSIVRADFVAEPRVLFTGSDIVALSGSLNTAKDVAFYDTIRRCFDASAKVFVFNFLNSPELAGAAHLYWREQKTVEKFCRGICGDVRLVDGYLDGDLTVVMTK